jgi:O-antigen ligase
MVLGNSVNPVFGTGFESFWLGERLRKMWSVYVGINQAHNGYIEIYLNLGWVGVSLLVLLILTGYRNVIAMLRREPSAGGMRLAYFVVGVIYNFTEASFKMMTPVWIMFLVAITAIPEVKSLTGSALLRKVPPEPTWVGVPGRSA